MRDTVVVKQHIQSGEQDLAMLNMVHVLARIAVDPG